MQHIPAEQRVTAESNQKGGVGKTTTTIQLGDLLARQGNRVLIFDMDSQRSLTLALGLEAGPGKPTILQVLTEPAQGISHVVRAYTGTAKYPVDYDAGCLHVLPGARSINTAPKLFQASVTRQPVATFDLVIPWVIQHFAQDYHHILLDPGPSDSEVTRAVMFAAQQIIAPVEATPMAMQGAVELLDTLTEINQGRARLGLPGQTHLLGLLATRVMPDQQEVLRQFHAQLKSAGLPYFDGAAIPYSTLGWRFAAEHAPIAAIDARDPVALAYRQIAEYVR